MEKFLKKLEQEGKIFIKTPCQLESIEGDTNIKSITLKFDDGKTEKIPTDIMLGFFGLIMKLGPIAEWGLNINKKTIEVNPENFETNKKGIFAAGDICSYPGKLKLILSGFHEVALASVECFKRARPNEKYRFSEVPWPHPLSFGYGSCYGAGLALGKHPHTSMRHPTVQDLS